MRWILKKQKKKKRRRSERTQWYNQNIVKIFLNIIFIQLSLFFLWSIIHSVRNQMCDLMSFCKYLAFYLVLFYIILRRFPWCLCLCMLRRTQCSVVTLLWKKIKYFQYICNAYICHALRQQTDKIYVCS